MYSRLARRLEARDDRQDGRPSVAGRLSFGYGFTPVRSLLFPRLRPLIPPVPRWPTAGAGPLEGY